MEPAPYFANVAQAPDGGAAHWLRCDDGVRIRAVHWPLSEAKGTVLMFPGRTEYAEKYGPSAQEYRSRGYAMVAIDWRGQGIADRLISNKALGHVGEFADYQLDVEAVLSHVRDLGMPEPYYLVAHSMGGCIGLRALHNRLPVRAAAFSAPMWGVLVPPVVRQSAWAIGYLGPLLGFGNRIAPGRKPTNYVEDEPYATNTLTRDEDMYGLMVKQLKAHPELGLGGPSIRWIGRALREMLALHKMPSPNIPCFTGVGTAEEIVDPGRIRDRMARWSKGELAIYDGAKHELMIETKDVRDDFFEKSTALFEANS